MMLRIIFLAFAGAFCTACSATEASDPRSYLPSGFQWEFVTNDRACGVYAVSQAASLLGKPSSPTELWTTDFISTPQGSTAEDIVQAVSVLGLNANTWHHMGVSDIHAIGTPVIANVRSSLDQKEYDHWVTIVSDGTSITIFDNAKPGRVIDASRFLAIWNGVGIVVSNGRAVHSFYLVSTFMCLLCLISASVSPELFWPSRVTSWQHEIIRVLLAVVAVAACSWFVFAWGFEPAKGFEHSLASYQQPTRVLPDVRLEELIEATGSPSVLLVDARKPRSFSLGTIDGAVNVPVNASGLSIETFFSKLARSTPIIVFCQSRSCGYARVVASRLRILGYTNVRSSEAGHHEYLSFSRG